MIWKQYIICDIFLGGKRDGKFLNGLVYLLFFRITHYKFWRYQDKNMKMVSQQYGAWLDCTYLVCAGWFGYILVAKASHFRFQQDMG